MVETLSLVYDELGRTTGQVFPSGSAVAFTFNERQGHGAVSFQPAAGSSRQVVLDTSYLPSSNVSRKEIALSACGSGACVGWASYEYDGLDRRRAIELELDGDVATVDYRATDFTFDARGFLTGLERSDAGLVGSVRYGYSGQGLLTSFSVETSGSPPVSTAAYTYDRFGNLEHRTGLSRVGLSLPEYHAFPDDGDPANDRYTAANRHPDWHYDQHGRLLRDFRYRYSYDSAGRLARLETPDGELVAHYLYDDLGRRARVLTDERVTYYFRDESGAVVSERVIDLETGEATWRDHVAHNGESVLTAETGPAGTRYEERLTDRLGNPVLRREDGVLKRQEYAPFGQQIATTVDAELHLGAYGFTGTHEDDPTGLTYMQARYYDAAAARFNRPDPARDFQAALPHTFNLYAYAYANPINTIDPSGLAGADAECQGGASCVSRANPVASLVEGLTKVALGLAAGHPGGVIAGAGDVYTSFAYAVVWSFDEDLSMVPPGNMFAAWGGQLVLEITGNPSYAAVGAAVAEAGVNLISRSGDKTARLILGVQMLRQSPRATAMTVATLTFADEISSVNAWEHYFAEHAVRFMDMYDEEQRRRAEKASSTWNHVWIESPWSHQSPHLHSQRADRQYATGCSYSWCELKEGRGYKSDTWE